VREGDEIGGAIGNAVEAMAAAEYFDLGVFFDEFPDLLD
jgi:hypothetical protein